MSSDCGWFFPISLRKADRIRHHYYMVTDRSESELALSMAEFKIRKTW